MAQSLKRTQLDVIYIDRQVCSQECGQVGKIVLDADAPVVYVMSSSHTTVKDSQTTHHNNTHTEHSLPFTRAGWKEYYRTWGMSEFIAEFNRVMMDVKYCRINSDAFQTAYMKMQAIDDILEEMFAWPSVQEVVWLVSEFRKLLAEMEKEDKRE